MGYFIILPSLVPTSVKILTFLLDEICEKANVIEEIDGGTSIGYMKTRGIWPTSPRDATTL